MGTPTLAPGLIGANLRLLDRWDYLNATIFRGRLRPLRRLGYGDPGVDGALGSYHRRGRDDSSTVVVDERLLIGAHPALPPGTPPAMRRAIVDDILLHEQVHHLLGEAGKASGAVDGHGPLFAGVARRLSPRLGVTPTEDWRSWPFNDRGTAYYAAVIRRGW